METTAIDVQLTVNGREVRALVPADLTLSRFLREQLGLTGTKEGCSQGHCGTCTVILNGKATRSCLIKMSRANGAVVETIEGLSSGGRLHPLQDSFIKEGAVQCGFCTPGMIMSAKALLEANPKPGPDEIKAHLTKNRNLCRCTGYVNIIKAIQRAADMMARGEEPGALPPEGLIVSSTRLTRDAVDLVTGKTRFSADLVFDGMLHGKILWAEHPHAEIVNIDTGEAEAIPGVVRVITARDIPGINQAGIVVRDQPAIAADKTRYIGDSLAAVFAETEEIARAAVDKIKVEYRVLPGVFSPAEAAAPNAPKVHEKGNLFHHSAIERGDVEAAFKKCAVVVEHRYSTPFIEHGFMEPEAGVGLPSEDGGVVIRICTQTVFDDRTQLSEILNLPEEKIRVIQVPIGGAFGGKEDMILQQYLALGALLTGRPVKIVLSRGESLRVHVKRHPAKMRYKTGADKEGRVLAIEADIVADAGAYASLTFDILENMIVFGAGPYYVPNLKLEGKAYYTNNVPAGAMRGFGVNQIAIALEQNMDEMARQLGIDPFDFRLLNALEAGLPTASDHLLEAGVVSIKETIEAARREFEKIDIPVSRGPKKIGVGVASAVKNIGFGHNIPESSGAIVELDNQGWLCIRHSQHEYGQGARGGLAQMAAMVLGVPVDRITLVGPDTALTPPTGPTTASRQTYMTGSALLQALGRLKEDLFGRAAAALKTSPEQLRINGDRMEDPVAGGSVTLADLGGPFIAEGEFVAPVTAAMLEPGEPSRYGQAGFESRPTHWCYAYNTQAAVVEVDTETGAVQVLKVVSANDLGKVLNRHSAEGQIHGGVMMGVGFALSEEFVVEKGYNRTDTLRKVSLPTADQSPEIIPVLVEVAHPHGPLGAKGFAEAPSLATAPAILNAIYDAIGVRIRDIPAKKEKVLAAMAEFSAE